MKAQFKNIIQYKLETIRDFQKKYPESHVGGSFGGAKTNRIKQLRVTCGSTDKDTVEKLNQLVGIGALSRESRLDPRRVERSKPFWVWSASKRLDVEELLWAIRPFMSKRRGERIDEILTYAKNNPLKYNTSKETPHGTANGYSHYNCRCEPCTRAATERARVYRARAKASGATLGEG